MSEGQGATPPLIPWRMRSEYSARDQQKCLPELHVTLGRDERSAGITITVWSPSAGEHPNLTVLWSRRWRDPVLSAEEALEIAYRGVAEALMELFGVDVR